MCAEDFLGELAVLVDGSAAAEGVRRGQGGEGGGGRRRCADDDRGGELAVGLQAGGLGASAVGRQIGEQDGQFLPRAGDQGLPGSLVELVGCNAAGLEGVAQLSECSVAIGIGYPNVAGGVVPECCVHDGYSLARRDGVLRRL
jgi:hypothetical protein